MPGGNNAVKKNRALARLLSWLEHRPIHQNVAGSIPNQGMYERQPINVSLSHWCFSPFLSPSLPRSSLSKINEHSLRWGLKKKKRKRKIEQVKKEKKWGKVLFFYTREVTEKASLRWHLRRYLNEEKNENMWEKVEIARAKALWQGHAWSVHALARMSLELPLALKASL